ncbi:MAG TPA: hypothetical protein PLF32_02295 [Bacteroidales bacterium]|jgi:hypothetical protein|nr:hypothetical protein [Bacteroidales bacterium]HOR81470.1 hypothetical protein [Bacteroidales bacterium]HOR81471.1 hypothetical protein [Bacteroidales bacterium]
MIKLVKKSNYLFILISISLVFYTSQQIDEFSRENKLIEHEFNARGMRISFILPEDYKHTEICDNIVKVDASGCDTDTLKAFCSLKNDINKFVILLEPIVYKELSIDTLIKDFFEFYLSQDMIPFFEKKYDNNNHVYYLLMAAKIDSIPGIKEQYIHSLFKYITIFGKTIYNCTLVTYDPIDSFSYEEKRKIIESVKIEEIK